MDSKITLATLSQLVAGKGDHDAQTCENVLRQMFRCISASLEGGENVKIKGLGTFKISDVASRKSVDVTSGKDNTIPAHRKIVFIPCKELAEAVNAPFEMFETVVIEENLLEEQLMEAETTGNEILAGSLRQEIILEEEKLDALKEEYPAEFSTEAKDIKGGEADGSAEDSDNSAEDSTEMPEDTEVAGESGEVTEESDKISEESEPDAAETPSSESEDKSKSDEPSESVESDDKNVNNEIVQDQELEREAHHKYEKPSRTVKKEQREIIVGKSHFWLWTILSGLAICVIGIALLWWLNDDFGNWGRSLFNPDRKVVPKESLLDPEVATIISDDENLAEENTDMTGLVEEQQPESEKNVEEADKKEEASSEQDVAPTKPSDESKPVYDVVTDTRYLSTIAREHYGNFNLWPYIYKENEKILGHPNRIRPGTKVVVPSLSKYGVDPKNPNDIDKAKKLGLQIYDRYQ